MTRVWAAGVEKVLESDDVLGALENARTDERLLPASVLPFDVPRSQPHAGAFQAKGARLILTLAESSSIVLASLLSGVTYHQLVLGSSGNLLALIAVGLLAAILFSGSMSAIETNQRLRKLDGPQAIRDVTLVWVGAILCVTFFAFSLKAGETLSRGSMLTFLVIGYFGIIATRTTVTRLLVKHYRPGRVVGHQVIVVGAEGDPTLDALRSELSRAGYAEPCMVRFNAKCSAREWPRERSTMMTRIQSLARTVGYGEICIAAGGFDDRRLQDVAVALQVIPRAVRIVPSTQIEQLLHLPIRSIGTLHSLELQKAPLNTVQRAVKRAMDIALSSAALLFLAPSFLIVAAAIRLTSSGPAIFKQTRLGHRGVPFDILKFRTMTVAENGPVVKQAQANDRRVTRVGRWLRKTSIDELPQLINVLRGQMSLVGPRPHAVAHDQYYTMLIGNYDIRQHVKPGITGWAQVNGLRGETSSLDLMRKRVEFDVWYAKNSGIMLDLRILILTVVEVLRQRNAY
jgi:undecaprenyl-phosphate galactose phosphotransferase/putative colanic acid biosynthesis UDP-glucose lipid carrier transferase